VENEETTNKGAFTVSIEFLRDIIAKQTFHDSPAAALRELIQNAHDACLIQSALTRSDDYAVHVTLDPVEKKIIIEDNGVGMSASDIEEYLTTVGRGKKGLSVAEKYGVTARNSDRLKNVIGEFGFGFIAAFIIADRIELWTRSARADSPIIYCEFSTEEVDYDWKEVEHGLSSSSGTKLVLTLNQSALARGLKPTDNPLEGYILNWNTVDAVIKKYCIFLEFPIDVTMNGEIPQTPSNQVTFPWKEESRLGEAVQRFYEDRFDKGNVGEFLRVFPLLLSRQAGHEVDLEGVLTLEDRPQTSEFPGNIEVFIKRMWVCDTAQDLLPTWASFLRGVIVTPELRPVPGRDNIDREHDSYDRVKKALHKIVRDGFLEIARKNPPVFNMMLQKYGPIFRWGLLEEIRLAEKERRPFEESELLRYVRFVRYGKRFPGGSICTLNDYLGFKPEEPFIFTQDMSKDKKRVIYYVARPVPADRQLEFRRLLASKTVDVIVPNDEWELALLMNVDDIFRGILLSNVEHEILKDVGLLTGDERARWSTFLKYYEKLAEEHHMTGAEVGAFDPEYMPTMIVNTLRSSSSDNGLEGEESENGEEKLRQSALICGVLPEIASLYSQVLVLNSRNRIMRQLLEYKEQLGLEEIDRVLSVCLHQCYHAAVQSIIGNLPSELLVHNLAVEGQIIQDYVERCMTAISSENADRNRLEELEVLRKERESYRSCYGELPQSGKFLAVPSEPTERMGVVIFCDMVDSTGNLLAMDFKERGFVLNRFVTMAKKEVQEREGFFDKFTGDGFIGLFGIEKEKQPDGEFSANDWQEACRQAWKFCNGMHSAMVDFNNDRDIRQIINKHNLDHFALRMAIDAGVVQFARFGGAGTAVGQPVIVAARLCAEKSLFKDNDADLLVSEWFRNKSGLSGFKLVSESFTPKGVNRVVSVYCAN
jgi:HSP90 family molecular chaperone/class 3 adenylate cyclase